jgi:hypothetical protein
MDARLEGRCQKEPKASNAPGLSSEDGRRLDLDQKSRIGEGSDAHPCRCGLELA